MLTFGTLQWTNKSNLHLLKFIDLWFRVFFKFYAFFNSRHGMTRTKGPQSDVNWGNWSSWFMSLPPLDDKGAHILSIFCIWKIVNSRAQTEKEEREGEWHATYVPGQTQTGDGQHQQVWEMWKKSECFRWRTVVSTTLTKSVIRAERTCQNLTSLFLTFLKWCQIVISAFLWSRCLIPGHKPNFWS